MSRSIDQESLGKRLFESRDSLMSRSHELDSMLSSMNVERKMETQDEKDEDDYPSSYDFINDIMKADGSGVLSGIVTKDISNDNLDGSKDVKVDDFNWSDCVMSSSADKSTASSDPERWDEAKCLVGNQNYEDLGASKETHYDDVEGVLVNKLKVNTIDADTENRCSITVTESHENLNNVMVDSLEESLSPVNISYQNLNRFSNMSGDSGKNCISKDSTPTYEQERTEEIYECFTFARPSYIHLASSSGGSNTPTSPPHLKSPIKSTISITYKSPTKENRKSFTNETADVLSNDCDDDAYEAVQTIGESAVIPKTWDASLPTQQACQPVRIHNDLISLETPTEDIEVFQPVPEEENNEVDIYNQVKFFRQSINEVNNLILTPENETFADSLEATVEQETENANIESGDKSLGSWYENVCFETQNINDHSQPQHSYENVLMQHADSSYVCDSSDQVTSPLTELCLDRRLKSNESRNKNVYENYKVPFSEKTESKINKYDITSSLEICEAVRSSPKLSLGDFDKENTGDNENLASPTDEKSKLGRSSTNVRQLAHKFESPTENKGPFSFDRSSKTNLLEKLSTLERKKELNHPFDRSKAASLCEGRNKSVTGKIVPCIRARNNRLAKYSTNTRSLDENAFVKEFGRAVLNRDHTSEREIAEQVFTVSERRKSLEAGNPKSLNQPKKILSSGEQCPTSCSNRDSLSLNLTNYSNERSLEEEEIGEEQFVRRLVSITPTTENKISLVQARLSPKKNQRLRSNNSSLSDSQKDLCDALSADIPSEKTDKMSRERIEKYKEERRLFLREKYSPHSFRGIGDLQMTCRNTENSEEYDDVTFDGIQLRNPGKLLERRNTADAVQRSKFSVVLNASKSSEKVIEEKPSVTEVTPEEETISVSQRKLSLDAFQSSGPPVRPGASWDGPKLARPKNLGIVSDLEGKSGAASKPEVVSSSSVR